MDHGQNQISFKCEICDKEFKNNKCLKNHFNIIHKNSEKKHQCNIWGNLEQIRTFLKYCVIEIGANQISFSSLALKKPIFKLGVFEMGNKIAPGQMALTDDQHV